MYVKDASNKYTYVGQTEMILDNQNPVFDASLTLQYDGENRKLKFFVFDANDDGEVSTSNLLGRTVLKTDSFHGGGDLRLPLFDANQTAVNDGDAKLLLRYIKRYDPATKKKKGEGTTSLASSSASSAAASKETSAAKGKMKSRARRGSTANMAMDYGGGNDNGGGGNKQDGRDVVSGGGNGGGVSKEAVIADKAADVPVFDKSLSSLEANVRVQKELGHESHAFSSVPLNDKQTDELANAYRKEAGATLIVE
jgi:hypothetical protein